MNDKKKLQKKMKSEFETPETSFEEWSAKSGIFSDAGPNANLAAEECDAACDGDGRVLTFKYKKRLFIAAAAVIALLISLTIILISVLPKKAQPKIYGITDAVTVNTDLQEIKSLSGVYLFDMSGVVQTQSVSKDVLAEDNSTVLLYSLLDNLLSVSNGSGFDAFLITYKIRTYKFYDFFGSNNYTNLEKPTSVGNISAQYSILQNKNPVAYVYFEIDGYEYFIEAQGFEGVTVLSEDNLINLLNKILI